MSTDMEKKILRIAEYMWPSYECNVSFDPLRKWDDIMPVVEKFAESHGLIIVLKHRRTNPIKYIALIDAKVHAIAESFDYRICAIDAIYSLLKTGMTPEEELENAGRVAGMNEEIRISEKLRRSANLSERNGVKDDR